MARIYHIVRGGENGRCGCGHKKHKNEQYWLIDGETRAKSVCSKCGKEMGLKGAKVTAEELHNFWFKGERIKETVCVALKQFSNGSRHSLKREEMLEVAVEV